MTDDTESDVTHRQLDTTAESPATEVANAVADIEGKEVTDLSSTYACIDGVLANVFSNPPSSEAEMQIKFNYESYRITVEQDGNAKFEKIE